MLAFSVFLLFTGNKIFNDDDDNDNDDVCHRCNTMRNHFNYRYLTFAMDRNDIRIMLLNSPGSSTMQWGSGEIHCVQHHLHRIVFKSQLLRI